MNISLILQKGNNNNNNNNILLLPISNRKQFLGKNSWCALSVPILGKVAQVK